MFIHELRNDPQLKPIYMQNKIHELYNVAPSHDQCRKAKKKALEMIEKEFNEQYARMKDYRDELKARNPHSTVEVRTEVNAMGTEVFDSFYICFSGLRDTWKDHCRPIFGIDGCFLKSDAKGQLLAAIGRDANNQIYPFAWAVVQVENTESWLWFIRHLKNDLGLGKGDGFTVISDRQKGLLNVVNEELPEIEHRMCARHIYGNMKKAHPKKPQMKTLFWRVVKSFNEGDYAKNLEKMKSYDIGVYEAFMSRNPRNCSLAFFKTHSQCEDALNNFSKSYNNTLEKPRAMPLIQSLETMRRQAMVRIAVRRKKAEKLKGKHTEKVSLVIVVEDKKVKKLRTIPGRPNLFEVIEKGHGHKVDMKAKTCQCRRWDLTGIPCRHALRVVFDNPRSYNIEDLISDCYLVSKLQIQYLESIGPVNGMKFWSESGGSRLEGKPREVHKGRKKNPEKQIKAITESPTKGKKVTNHGRVMHCYRCGFAAHNSSKCPNVDVPFKPRPPKKKKKN
uniref:SWIM-type domain-containing protein n=2 Tax=Noccaea caerulescens TaxID=107243 RepID=A0A1J3G5W3_NOCCA